MDKKINFPDKLRYNNIPSSMGNKANFISNRDSIFPHDDIENHLEKDLPTTYQITEGGVF